MRQITFLLLVVLGYHPLTAQSLDSLVDILNYKDSIAWTQLQNNKITTEQWYNQIIALGHYDHDIQAWFNYEDSIDILNKVHDSIPDSNSVILYVPKHYQVERKNGGKYIKLYLINLSDSTLTLQRIDATIGRFSAEIYIDNQWLEFQNTKGSSCGNSYWKGKLKPDHFAAIEVSNEPLVVGDHKRKMRIVYDHYNHKIFSKEIEVLLNGNQLARIKHSIENK
jgi:hypothetical protein